MFSTYTRFAQAEGCVLILNTVKAIMATSTMVAMTTPATIPPTFTEEDAEVGVKLPNDGAVGGDGGYH